MTKPIRPRKCRYVLPLQHKDVREYLALRKAALEYPKANVLAICREVGIPSEEFYRALREKTLKGTGALASLVKVDRHRVLGEEAQELILSSLVPGHPCPSARELAALVRDLLGKQVDSGTVEDYLVGVGMNKEALRKRQEEGKGFLSPEAEGFLERRRFWKGMEGYLRRYRPPFSEGEYTAQKALEVFFEGEDPIRDRLELVVRSLEGREEALRGLLRREGVDYRIYHQRRERLRRHGILGMADKDKAVPRRKVTFFVEQKLLSYFRRYPQGSVREIRGVFKKEGIRLSESIIHYYRRSYRGREKDVAPKVAFRPPGVIEERAERIDLSPSEAFEELLSGGEFSTGYPGLIWGQKLYQVLGMEDNPLFQGWFKEKGRPFFKTVLYFLNGILSGHFSPHQMRSLNDPGFSVAMGEAHFLKPGSVYADLSRAALKVPHLAYWGKLEAGKRAYELGFFRGEDLIVDFYLMEYTGGRVRSHGMGFGPTLEGRVRPGMRLCLGMDAQAQVAINAEGMHGNSWGPTCTEGFMEGYIFPVVGWETVRRVTWDREFHGAGLLDLAHIQWDMDVVMALTRDKGVKKLLLGGLREARWRQDKKGDYVAVLRGVKLSRGETVFDLFLRCTPEGYAYLRSFRWKRGGLPETVLSEISCILSTQLGWQIETAFRRYHRRPWVELLVKDWIRSYGLGYVSVVNPAIANFKISFMMIVDYVVKGLCQLFVGNFRIEGGEKKLRGRYGRRELDRDLRTLNGMREVFIVNTPAKVSATEEELVVRYEYPFVNGEHGRLLKRALRRLDELGGDAPIEWLGNRRVKVEYAWE